MKINRPYQLGKLLSTLKKGTLFVFPITGLTDSMISVYAKLDDLHYLVVLAGDHRGFPAGTLVPNTFDSEVLKVTIEEITVHAPSGSNSPTY